MKITRSRVVGVFASANCRYNDGNSKTRCARPGYEKGPRKVEIVLFVGQSTALTVDFTTPTPHQHCFFVQCTLHNCSTKKSTKITGIDEDGNYHDLTQYYIVSLSMAKLALATFDFHYAFSLIKMEV